MPNYIYGAYPLMLIVLLITMVLQCSNLALVALHCNPNFSSLIIIIIIITSFAPMSSKIKLSGSTCVCHASTNQCISHVLCVCFYETVSK